MDHANGPSYVLGGGVVILHTYIHFHGDLGQRGHAKGPSQKNHLKAKSKWTFQSQAPLVVEIEGKKHGKAAQFYSTF